MNRLITISVAVLMMAGNSWAAMCNAIEYSELKDMTKKELAEEYCIAKRLSDKLLAKRDRLPDDAYFKDLDSCLGLKKRIGRVMEKRSIKEPACPDSVPDK